MPFAFEVQHGVDDMLERLRPGKAAVFRDMADQERRHVLSFRGKQQLGRGFAHLTDAAGRRLELEREHRLDRVDDDKGRLDARDLFEDPLEAGFGQEISGASPMARRSPRDLI